MPNLSKEQIDDFDAELVVLADREFVCEYPFSTAVTVKNRPTYTALIDPILMARSESFVDNKSSDLKDKVARLKHSISGGRDKLIRKVGREVEEIILEGRVKLAFLIDSAGGNIELQSNYTTLAEDIKSRGGMVEAYIAGTAASAGFGIMAVADEVNVLDRSSLMWHFSAVNDLERQKIVKKLADGEELSEQNETELDELLDFAARQDGFSGEYEDYLIDKIIAPENKSGEIYFEGLELFNNGALTSSYQQPEGLRDLFRARFPITNSSRVREFWHLTSIIVWDNCQEISWHHLNFEDLRSKAAIRERSRHLLRALGRHF